MMGEIFDRILEMMKSGASITITINIIIAVVLFIVGFRLFVKAPFNSTKRHVRGWLCISLAILAGFGAITTGIFAYISLL